MGVNTRNRIVTDGLVLHLDAANSLSYPKSGTVWSDLSGNGNNGTLINGPTFDSGNGGSIVFDGVNDYGVLSITDGLSVNDITLNVVAKVPPQSSASLLFIFNRTDYLTLGNYTGEISGPPNGESFSMVKFNPVNLISTVTGGEWRFTDNLYHDFVFTRVNNIDTFYVDGIVVGSFISNQPIANQLYPIEIGQRINSPFFKQIISSIYRIYNRALTQQEILQNYNALKSRFNLT
jgi:hypothetical protein